MSRLFLSFLFSIFFLNVFASPNMYGDITFEKAINISGKQRYLSQKIVKEALFSFKNETELKSNMKLLSTKLIFERHHKLLLENATNEDIKNKLNEVKAAYDALNRYIENEDRRNAVESIFMQSSPILKKCQGVVDAVIESSVEHASAQPGNTAKQEEYSQLINVSGKQRMLSQKMSLLYIASTDGFLKRPVDSKEVLTVMEEFDKGLTTLLISSNNDQAVMEGLSTVMLKWNTLDANKKELVSGELDYVAFNADCDYFLDCFNKVTGMYEDLLTKK